MGRREYSGHHECHPRCCNHVTANNLVSPVGSLVQSNIAPHPPSNITTPALLRFWLEAACCKTAWKLVRTATMRDEQDKGWPFEEQAARKISRFATFSRVPSRMRHCTPGNIRASHAADHITAARRPHRTAACERQQAHLHRRVRSVGMSRTRWPHPPRGRPDRSDL